MSDFLIQTIHKHAKDVLGEVGPYQPDPDKPTPPKSTNTYKKETQESKILKKNISTAVSDFQSAMNTRKTTQEIDHYYILLDNARKSCKQYHSLRQILQLSEYVSAGTLQFSLKGPTLNEAWSLFRQIANKISRRTSHLLALVLYNKNQHADRASLCPSEKPTNTTAHSDRAWGQCRFSLGHKRRNHPSSPFNEKEANKIVQEVENMIKTSQSQPQSITPLPPSEQEESITKTEIKKLIDSLPPDKTPGVDGIPNRILQAEGENFLTTLIFFLQTIWEIKTYPEEWTKSYTTHLKGRRETKT